MIRVSGLSKNYGPIKALDRVSFEVGEGEVLGFLGPNGAGKSTTLRILTGFLPADEGEVTVAGFDIRSRSLEARSHIGYLPEGVPLYPEMRVGEYLRFRSRLKGIARADRRKAETRALELAGVLDMERRIVGTLSRGYRQRVGLADALLGDPRILILDEPSVGLDPEQLRQFRALIKDLGKKHTIILSTHILSEAEMMASRVSIIVLGKIVAQDTAENLRSRLGSQDQVRAEIAPGGSRLSPADMAREIQKLPGVALARLEREGPGGGERSAGPEDPAAARPASFLAFLIRPAPGSDPRTAVFELARDRGWILRELSQKPVPLEEIFLEIISAVPSAVPSRRVGPPGGAAVPSTAKPAKREAKG
jgi:gliding motility-associated transport system ATP-binding protein